MAALTFILIPLIAASVILFVQNILYQQLLSGLVLIVLSFFAFLLFTSSESLIFALPHLVDIAVIFADIILLFYFIHQGRVYNDNKVLGLGILQLILYGWIEMLLPSSSTSSIVIDELSKMMFVIINTVGGIIIFYAVKYISYEKMDGFRKRLFLAYLFIFLSIMNALVMVNSILLFFFLFEMTTLASYLLIGFRKDELSQKNALRALWMNQIGGMVILLGAVVTITMFDTVAFDQLLSSSGGYLLFAVALLSMAAFVKGAAMPFDGWLLGAMVAPTPVSAMLHSATMVKIAPYMILKFAPVLAGTLLGGIVSVYGALVFVAASYFALSKEIFKEILGYSTIALLGLMVSLAAIGTQASQKIVIVLILFHAFSKALLFLTTGVLEKEHHMKSIESMKGLVQRAPKSVAFLIFGFMTLVLPPFGLFMGKLFALQAVSGNMMRSPWQIIVLLGVIIGSVLLSLLYFKVVSALLAKESDIKSTERESLPAGFALPLILLSAMIVSASVWLFKMQSGLPLYYLLIPLVLLIFIPWFYRKIEGFDRTTEYHCGEKETFDAALFYFDTTALVKRRLYWFFGLLFGAVALAGVIS